MENQSDNNEAYLKKLHQDILIIMDEVDRICTENHLRYYLMCGSCLGAIRHKGFIPWDDDLDIAMPRFDFNRFLTLISKSNKEKSVLGEKFYLRWVTTEKQYNHTFAKICLKGTSFIENNGAAAQNAGIFVDVFPLDACNSYGKKIEIKNRIVTILTYCLYYKGSEHYQFDWNLKHWIIRIIAKLFSNRALNRIILAVIRPSEKDNYDFQAFYGTPYPIRRMLFPKSWHGEGKRIMFEGRDYSCPSESELYLERIYGHDYMQIPPENKRKTHYPIRVVFSDSTEMRFEKTKQKVKYKDLID